MGHFVQKVNPELRPVISFVEQAAPTSLLYDQAGNRKYLTATERSVFLRMAAMRLPEERTFCMLLAYSGCRISEALATTPLRIDPSAGAIIIETLKRRRRGIFRAVPIPSMLIRELENVHNLSQRRGNECPGSARIWPWCRTRAWEIVKAAMEAADISGPHASPKGLRHSFAVTSLQAGVPITLVKKWLGHARLSTTEIYADAMGAEERVIAGRLWETFAR